MTIAADAPAEDRPALRSAPCGRSLPYALAPSRPHRPALVALVVASLATLVVPIAVRRMVDFGFSGGQRRPDPRLFRWR